MSDLFSTLAIQSQLSYSGTRRRGDIELGKDCGPNFISKPEIRAKRSKDLEGEN
ncbi:hypothetical protein COCCADRAFT_10635 [Bipolaris zeicola 26-R-13]|uniref:Uncharacterized protein n=1 Tax=Cochliobolus carbonum (strain 26-R-13) TaxID=930089 RepID=W6XUZ9_COCC2|nr:uncharacterized protein COCCADRAFT_10635 [Bipolaris zeicola 26-R-13]EUC26604.1 hypothetical protein COCCADRAFT_10635 [Bipolaris zeicola 26-R-13]